MREIQTKVVKANKHINTVSDNITHLNLNTEEDIKYFITDNFYNVQNLQQARKE